MTINGNPTNVRAMLNTGDILDRLEEIADQVHARRLLREKRNAIEQCLTGDNKREEVLCKESKFEDAGL